MSHIVLPAVCALLLGMFPPAAHAVDPASAAQEAVPARLQQGATDHAYFAAREHVTDLVRQVAFDPQAYFPNRSIIRIAYTGDDYGWPVYSIAIAEGCIAGENRSRDNCDSRLRARMVRAPAVPQAMRPRLAGLDLASRVTETGAVSTEQVRLALRDMDLEWVEADLRACPGAVATLARSAEADWVPAAVANPTPNDDMSGLVRHADVVRVDLQQHARLTTYSGWLAEGSPGAWAVEMATALEQCWRPISAPPPWA
jgi:hypothetical protein